MERRSAIKLWSTRHARNQNDIEIFFQDTKHGFISIVQDIVGEKASRLRYNYLTNTVEIVWLDSNKIHNPQHQMDGIGLKVSKPSGYMREDLREIHLHS